MDVIETLKEKFLKDWNANVGMILKYKGEYYVKSDFPESITLARYNEELIEDGFIFTTSELGEDVIDKAKVIFSVF